MRRTPFLSALELVVAMAAVTLQLQNATVIRVGAEHLVQLLSALPLALYMDSVTRFKMMNINYILIKMELSWLIMLSSRKGNDVCVNQASWGTVARLVSGMIMELDSGGV